MIKFSASLAALLATGLLAGCQPAQLKPGSSTLQYSDDAIETASQTLSQAEDEYLQLQVAAHPYAARSSGLLQSLVLPDLSNEFRQQQQQQLQQLKTSLQQLEYDALPANRQLQARALQYRIGQQLEWHECSQQWPALSAQGSVLTQVLKLLTDYSQPTDIPSFHSYLREIEGAAAVIKQWQQQLQQQQKTLHTLSYSRDALLRQLDRQLQGYPFSDSSQPAPLWSAIVSKLQALDVYPSSYEILQGKASSTLTNYLLPSLRSLYNQLNSMPTSTSLSWQQQPNGDSCYRLQLAQLGSTEAPELLQEIAKSRLSALQQQLRTELALDPGQPLGSQLRAWLASHQVAPIPLKPAVLDRLQNLNGQLPQRFAVLPQTPLVVLTSQDAAVQLPYYQPPQPSTQQPGIYWTTAVETSAHWRWPLDLYRASLPGKHLQYALAQENAELPDFMKYPLHQGFEPGWLSIAAELANDLGGYESSAEHAWVLLDDMEQELNLVLDIGIHLYQWNQEKAAGYCQVNSFLSDTACQQRAKAIMEAPGQFGWPAISKANLLELIRQAQDNDDSAAAMASFYSSLLQQGDLPPTLYSQWLNLWQEAY
ncbi:DUF885 family protein [Oceanobacter mangrovi]|uniref:DUF885 family protein n=1 Tax=Oceanobacter mangrovi TaxID=2862510 RepID=UPI001C8EF40C|nr:DUF885 family protein [Oceanobacter mangrovi]